VALASTPKITPNVIPGSVFTLNKRNFTKRRRAQSCAIALRSPAPGCSDLHDIHQIFTKVAALLLLLLLLPMCLSSVSLA
jgi:hypothetical protein